MSKSGGAGASEPAYATVEAAARVARPPMPVEEQVLVVRGARDLVSGRHGGPRFVGRSNVQHAGRAVLTLGALCVMIERPFAKWRRSAAGPASLPAWLPDDECVRRACHCLCTQPMPRVVLAGQQGGAAWCKHGAVASWLVDRRDACPPRPHCVHTACTGDRRLNRVCVLLRGRCSACAAVSQERDCVLPGIVYPYVQERATEEVRLAHYAPRKSRGPCAV